MHSRIDISLTSFLAPDRRSASFAFPILAITRAEPRHCGATVLPSAMRHLLDIATATTATTTAGANSDNGVDWRVGVHAMNVCRLVFLDAYVGDDVFR